MIPKLARGEERWYRDGGFELGRVDGTTCKSVLRAYGSTELRIFIVGELILVLLQWSRILERLPHLIRD